MKQIKMSRAPATPDKSNKTSYSAKVAVPRILMHPPRDTATSSSFHEPSPASTYGETVAGDSTPVTPEEGIHNGKYAILLSSQFHFLPSSPRANVSAIHTLMMSFSCLVILLRHLVDITCHARCHCGSLFSIWHIDFVCPRLRS